MQKLKVYRVFGIFPLYLSGYWFLDWIQYMSFGVVFGMFTLIGVDKVAGTDFITSSIYELAQKTSIEKSKE